jgi:membrane-bound ClpP family serine protease
MEHLGIILLIIGFILVGVEMTMPGFGFPGITGALSLMCGIIFSADTIEHGIFITIIVIVLLAIMGTIIFALLKRKSSPLILSEHLDSEDQQIGDQDLQYLVGKTGIASTDLKPSGKVDIDGVEFDARSETRYIDKGSAIRIIRIHENSIIVK